MLSCGSIMDCNLTIAVFYVTPFLTIEIINGKIISNSPNILRFTGLVDFFARSLIRVILYDAGELANADMMMLMDKKGIELAPLPISLSSRESIEDDGLMPIVAEQKIVVVSLAPEIPKEPYDVLNLIDWKLWACGLFLISLVLMIWKLLTRPYSIRSAVKDLGNPLWATMELILRQNFSQNQQGASKFLLSSIALFTFFLLSFLNSLVSTDFVMGEKPFMIDRLEDILDPRADNYKPVWRKFEGTHTIFSKSHYPTKQKIWQKAESIGLDQCFVDSDAVSAFNMGRDYASTPIVAFTYELLANYLRIHTCGQISPVPWRTFHLGNEIAGSELSSLPCRLHNDLCKKYKKTRIQMWSTIVMEANFLNLKSTESVVKDTFQVQDKLHEKWECIFGKDPYELEDQYPIEMLNIRQLLIFLFFDISLATFVLSIRKNKFSHIGSSLM